MFQCHLHLRKRRGLSRTRGWEQGTEHGERSASWFPGSLAPLGLDTAETHFLSAGSRSHWAGNLGYEAPQMVFVDHQSRGFIEMCNVSGMEKDASIPLFNKDAVSIILGRERCALSTIWRLEPYTSNKLYNPPCLEQTNRPECFRNSLFSLSQIPAFRPP